MVSHPRRRFGAKDEEFLQTFSISAEQINSCVSPLKPAFEVANLRRGFRTYIDVDEVDHGDLARSVNDILARNCERGTVNRTRDAMKRAT